MAKKNSRNIRKKEEFLAFTEELKGGTIAHWQDIAIALGVENDTITAWKKYPEAQQAIREGIKRALNGMQKAGKRDWRMWESKLKMLGVIPKQAVDITTKGEKLPTPILDGLRNNNGNKEDKPVDQKD